MASTLKGAISTLPFVLSEYILNKFKWKKYPEIARYLFEKTP